MSGLSDEEFLKDFDDYMKKSPDFEKIKQQLTKRLIESGWLEDVRKECLDLVRDMDVSDGDASSHLDVLVKHVGTAVRGRLPADAKKELLEGVQILVAKFTDNLDAQTNSDEKKS